jgi:hypothetical protein
MREAFLAWRARYKRYEPVIFFAAGFLFDVFTLRRIDDWLKLGFQIGFLALLGFFLTLQYRELKPDWVVPAALRKIWPYQIEIVHFLFGSLLSAYAIFYFKSASATRSGVFLLLIIILMVLNELEFVRKQGVHLRVTLYSFCLASFFVYFFPIVNGYVSDFLFYVSVALASAMTCFLVLRITKQDPPEIRRKQILRMVLPALGVNLVLLGAYGLKLIPPVPLSMTFGGVYHKVEKVEGRFELYSLRPWYNFWTHGDKVFAARDGEPVFCFVRIFAPAQFSHTIYLRWQLYDEKHHHYVDQDRIGMPISGGREDGFRGYAYKSHYQQGKWRIIVETQDERPIGEISFVVEPDATSDERTWMIEEG